MKTKLVVLLVLCVSFFTACSDDDPVIEPVEKVVEKPKEDATPDPAVVLAEEREVSITTLTAKTSKVWKIATAELKNSNGSFDISTNFNVTDDEFIFSEGTSGKTEFEGTLEWRRNNSIAFLADSEEAAKNDFYLSPETYTFDFAGDSNNTLLSLGAQFDFEINENGEISGVLSFDDGAIIEVTLTEKLAVDYQQVPTTALTFTEAFSFDSNFVDSGAVGMSGSLSDNSFFIALRDNNLDGSASVERVLRFDLDGGGVTESYYDTMDFVSKQLIPHNGKLLVAGGQRVTTYNLDLSGTPVSSPDYATSLGLDYLGLSRFGTAMVNGELLLIGGELDNFANSVFSFDTATESASFFAELPAPRFGARGEVVNNQLYVFGGTAEFVTPPANNTIFIYDLENNAFATETMPVALNYTYTGKVENLIYVAGRIDVIDENYALVDREPYLGVYDTNTGVFTQLETNLTSPDVETIHSMAVFKNKLYVLYGQGEALDGQVQTWSVLSADI